MNALNGASILVALAFMAGCIACVLVSRKQYAAGARKQDECMLQIAELARSVVDLESSRRGIEEVSDRGISHSRRAQAIQLLESGMTPESAASSLGMATREIRLIAEVSRVRSS